MHFCDYILDLVRNGIFGLIHVNGRSLVMDWEIGILPAYEYSLENWNCRLLYFVLFT